MIKPLNFQTYKDWRNAHKVNLDSVFIISKILSKVLLKNRGKIVNIGSIFSETVPNFSNYKGTDMNSPAAYSVSKNTLVHLTKWQASYFAPYVNVNMVSPGGILGVKIKDFKKNILIPPCKECAMKKMLYLQFFFY